MKIYSVKIIIKISRIVTIIVIIKKLIINKYRLIYNILI